MGSFSPKMNDRIFPVSYTHLDVYKRQRQDLLIASDRCIENDFALGMTIGADGFAPEHATCLLYTSRCV